jgi:hypothetical protein
VRERSRYLSFPSFCISPSKREREKEGERERKKKGKRRKEGKEGGGGEKGEGIRLWVGPTGQKFKSALSKPTGSDETIRES